MVTGGTIVMVTVCGVPLQVPADDVGVTLYITVCEDVELLVITSEIVVVVWAVVVSPEVEVLSAALHE